MCGRFAQFSPTDILKAQLDLDEVVCDPSASYNIAPTAEVLAVIEHGGLRLGTLSWGLVPSFLKDKPPKRPLINARSETVAEKPSFRKAFVRKRCVIPADGYYEWARQKNQKIPYYIYRPEKTIMAFAGLWESFRDEEGQKHNSCTIITHEAKGLLRDIHSRMPVVLDDSGRGLWLDSGLTDKERLQGILQNQAITDLSFHRVSDRVNKASFNSPECIIDYAKP